MRLTCTCCGATGSIEMFSADADARRLVELVAKLPAGVAPVAIRYVALFRPMKTGLRWDRACKLMTELAGMMEAGSIERRGLRIAAGADSFIRAMQQMLDGRERLELPLSNHNYLIAIVAGDAPKAAAAAESASEELRRMASQQRSGSASRIAVELASEEAARKRLRLPPMTEQERTAFARDLEAKS